MVIDSGLGDASDVWSELHPKFAVLTRTCVYDRAGLGRSDNGPLPRSSEQIVKELHTLLTNAFESGPFLFVAHSMAGYDAVSSRTSFPANSRVFCSSTSLVPIKTLESPRPQTKIATTS